MLRKIRILIAAVVLAAALFLFLDVTGYAAPFTGWIAKIQLVPAVLAFNFVVVAILLAVTLLFGRVYCSVLCPLGIVQDLLSHLGGQAKPNRFKFRKGVPAVRALFLVAFVILLLAGMASVAAFVEPYGIFGRIVTFFDGSPVARVTSFVTLALIAVLSFAGGRLWCNWVCPVGTLLGFVSCHSLFKPVIDASKCTGCTLCARNCKASCIDSGAHKIDYSRCVACMDCIGKCKGGAISYKFVGWACKGKPSPEGNGPSDGSRRTFLAAAAMASTAATLGAQEYKVDGGLAALEKKKVPEIRVPLRPAGAQSLKHFSRNCVACQLCVSKCPSSVLRPSSSALTLMQPELDYRYGWCRPSCNLCSQVCPAGAIKPVSVEEKSSIRIGHAVWIRENCVVVTDGVSCGNCERHCPAGAIRMVPSAFDGDLMIPSVNAERCIGCGSCEYHCPARPFSAIYVTGHEVHSTK